MAPEAMVQQSQGVPRWQAQYELARHLVASTELDRFDHGLGRWLVTGDCASTLCDLVALVSVLVVVLVQVLTV